MDDGYTYPVRTYMQGGREWYSYRCSRCHGIVNGYRKMRVKGRVICYSCKREIAKQKYHERKVEEWNIQMGEM